VEQHFNHRMRRRAVLAGMAAALTPLASRAQQPSMPVVGYLTGLPTKSVMVDAFFQGLAAGGFVEGKNVAIEYRGAEGHPDRLPALAADLVRRRVDVIAAAAPTTAALAAKAATSTIPIVFVNADDAVKLGLVASLNHPGGNVTGQSIIAGYLAAKQLDLLHQLLPHAAAFGMLVNPSAPRGEFELSEAHAWEKSSGVRLVVEEASVESELAPAFARFVAAHVDGLLQINDGLFASRYDRLVPLAAEARLPTMYSDRPSVAAGGLMSYGADVASVYRRAGGYVARILKGEKPADLPVEQPTTFDLVINAKTAAALGLTIPLLLTLTADEVIE
jgi:putative tryptophan/tyrosine transport system substrate-binding protein